MKGQSQSHDFERRGRGVTKSSVPAVPCFDEFKVQVDELANMIEVNDKIGKKVSFGGSPATTFIKWR